MPAVRRKEKSVRTRWVVELFPFSTKYPSTSDSSPLNLSVPITLIASNQDSSSFQAEIQKQENKTNSGEPTTQEVIVAGGLTSLRISRTKKSPDAQCTFQITGTVPADAFPGTWVLITSINTNPDGTERKLVRFIGQIYNMEPQYAVSPSSGVIQTRTTFQVREWSAALETPVRYDIFAIINSLPSNTAMAAIGTVASAFGAADEKVSVAELQKIVTESFNPFELAHLILKLIGAINSDDTLNAITSLGELGLPTVAVTMPSVPPNLLQRLGLPSVDSDNPFGTGLVDVITGVQQGGIFNDGTWDGIFAGSTTPTVGPNLPFVGPPAPVGKPSIEEYKNGFDKNPPDRPIALGLAALVSTGESAWTLINQHCDPALNEFFTDILYQPGDTPGSIVAKPVIFVRDKPFLMKKLKSANNEVELDSWTVYDELPRVRVDNVYITNFKLSNTFINSPNFLRVNFQSQTIDANLARTLSQIYGTSRLLPEMRRFGGQEFFVETQFLSKDVIAGKALEIQFQEWFKKIKGVATAWHTHNYRMANGVLVMRDDNIPITIGFNLQFTFGEFEIVGHVETMDISYTVDPETGRHETITQVQLSRIVHEFGGQLDFIDPSAFANLLASTPTASPEISFDTSGIGAALGAIGSVLGLA